MAGAASRGLGSGGHAGEGRKGAATPPPAASCTVRARLGRACIRPKVVKPQRLATLQSGPSVLVYVVLGVRQIRSDHTAPPSNAASMTVKRCIGHKPDHTAPLLNAASKTVARYVECAPDHNAPPQNTASRSVAL